MRRSFPPREVAYATHPNTQADFRGSFAFCGYPWVTSHVFRKTVATQMDEQEKSARAIADQLGHSKPSMTQDKYLARRRVTGATAVLEVIGDFKHSTRGRVR